MERSVGIIVHRSNQQAWRFAIEVIAWLQERAVTVRLDEQTGQKLQLPESVCGTEVWESVDFVITLGGDGTILTAARMTAPYGIPILGVHMGRFGFIAEAHPNTLFGLLELALDDRIKREERMMIHAEIWRDGDCVQRSLGLNDAVVKSGTSSLLDLQLTMGGKPFATYPADGIIVATPTGSTGYSLSAGGPIVEPTVQALIVTPICPHTLSARPMVVPCDGVVEILLAADDGEVLFKMDGLDTCKVKHGDRVIVRRSSFAAQLLVPDNASFYRKVRARYLYGERLNEINEPTDV
jgi:NAD+ kinase